MDEAQLIGLVEDAAPDGTALDRVAAAVRLGDDVSDAADASVRHFVDAARRAGHSWTEIGARMGVSKQAARKRFPDVEPVLEDLPELEVRPRLAACLDVARREAEADGAAEPGSQHLLLGLLAEGYAANLLDRLGVTHERARAEVRRLFPSPSEPDPDKCLAAAARFARECDHGFLGTEHVLFVLAHDRASRGNRVLERLGVAAAIRREMRCFERPRARPWPRRRPRPGQCSCSFCGHRQDRARLVAGPGVWICRHCVGLAADTLRTRSA